MPEDISNPHWYVVSRDQSRLKVEAGPYHSHAEAFLALDNTQKWSRTKETTEYTIADIRFATFEGLVQRPATKTEIEELREELVRLEADFRSHVNSTRHPWL